MIDHLKAFVMLDQATCWRMLGYEFKVCVRKLYAGHLCLCLFAVFLFAFFCSVKWLALKCYSVLKLIQAKTPAGLWKWILVFVVVSAFFAWVYEPELKLLFYRFSLWEMMGMAVYWFLNDILLAFHSWVLVDFVVFVKDSFRFFGVAVDAYWWAYPAFILHLFFAIVLVKSWVRTGHFPILMSVVLYFESVISRKMIFDALYMDVGLNLDAATFYSQLLIIVSVVSVAFCVLMAKLLSESKGSAMHSSNDSVKMDKSKESESEDSFEKFVSDLNQAAQSAGKK